MTDSAMPAPSNRNSCNSEDDVDGFGFFRALVVALPIGAAVWGAIVALVAVLR